jgi:cysteinyl-tRNA synthetase
MALRLYNTLTRSLEKFEPLSPPAVKFYACGPTIYNYAHIGNYRTFVASDLLRRYLTWLGYDVTFVMNLTDVDDKVIQGAAAQGSDIRDFTRPFGEQILEDASTIGIQPANSYPKATDFIPEMIAWIRRLEENGLAYAADDGVYFKISEFADYGKLKGLDPDSLLAGARVAVDEYEKEDARDFVLWKLARGADEEVNAAWDSPWGRGRPGWHLECSVMSIAELGETIDIHLGGEDLVFPHHENEIAQSEGATGKTFARFWVHVKHLIVEGEKMSKSRGNTVTVRQLLEEGVEPAAIRHQLISAQYRSELNFTAEGIAASRQALQRMLDFRSRLDSLEGTEGADEVGIGRSADTAVDRFRDAMDNDLNSSEALAAVFVMVKEVNAVLDGAESVSPGELQSARDALSSMDRVLGLVELAKAGRSVDDGMASWIEGMIVERKEARASKDFARADEIRDELTEKGVVLEDSAEGTRWKIVR